LRFRYVYSGGGEGILSVAGGASFEVTDTDPLGLDLPVLRALPRAEASDPAGAARTADALHAYLAWAHARLRSPPPARPAPAGAGAPPRRRPPHHLPDYEVGGPQIVLRAVRAPLGPAPGQPP